MTAMPVIGRANFTVKAAIGSISVFQGAAVSVKFGHGFCWPSGRGNHIRKLVQRDGPILLFFSQGKLAKTIS